MILSIKDGIFAAVYIISMATLWNGFRNDIGNNAKDTKTNSDNIKELSDLFKRVMFSESGELLLTSKKDCGATQAAIDKKFEEGKNSASKALWRIEKINENIIRIMCHLDIDESCASCQIGPTPDFKTTGGNDD